jgi:hypothetical protein
MNKRFKILTCSLVIIISGLITACKKTRTCSCNYQQTLKEVTTPDNGQITTNSTSSTGVTTNTYNRVKKSDLKEEKNCSNRKETTVSSYSFAQMVPTQSVLSGVSFTIYVRQVTEILTTTDRDYTCEIK